MSLLSVANEVLAEIRLKSQRELYRNDYHAWRADILGYRSYERMDEITWQCLHGDLTHTAVASANGVSKDLALDTPILTTEGWKTMGSVKVGDFVFSEEGKPIRVSWKSEVFKRPSFRVVFDDGFSLVSSDSHEWNTLTLNTRSHLKVGDWRDCWDSSVTVTTGEVMESLRASGGAANHLIPLARPVQFPERDLRVDPYVLGVWLGDGTSVRAEITCNYAVDGYVVDRVSKVYPLQSRGNHSFTAVLDDFTPRKGGATSRFYLDLKALDVVGRKHIPTDYLFGSVEQRIELVRGLMDSDGWADSKNGMAGWSQSSVGLVDQFCGLLSGLGVRFSRHEYSPKRGRNYWVVKFRSWFDPFTPGERKSQAFNSSSKKQRSRLTGRTIVDVVPVESVPTQCIEVESERHLFLAGEGLIPTHNSWEMSNMIAWASSVFEPGDVTSIVTAPSIQQVEKVIWAYLKNHFGVADARGNRMPGRLTEKLEWVYDGEHGKQFLAYGRVPSPGKEMAVFQGVRGTKGRVFVFSDEGGAIAKDMFTAMEAVTTGSGSRAVVFGNPDYPQAYWRRFWDKSTPEGKRWATFNVSAYELPSMTGEVVYPDDPDMNERFLSAITSREWIEDKEKIWDKNEARYLSKVLGQFPEQDDFSFFPQSAIDLSYKTDIEPDADAPIVLGVDIARWGQDESVIASNQGGHVRVVDHWAKCDLVDSARRIHAYAQSVGAVEVRIDSTGVGGGVFDMLARLPEFHDAVYEIVGWDNGSSAPDPTQHANKRAFSHDSLRVQMSDGLIDLDFSDSQLREELQAITYKFNNRGAIQITPKDELKKGLNGMSPDRLDAVIMASADLSPWTGNPYNSVPVGTAVLVDREDLFDVSDVLPMTGAGLPML